MGFGVRTQSFRGSWSEGLRLGESDAHLGGAGLIFFFFFGGGGATGRLELLSLGFRVQGSGFRVKCLWFRVQGLGLNPKTRNPADTQKALKKKPKPEAPLSWDPSGAPEDPLSIPTVDDINPALL